MGVLGPITSAQNAHLERLQASARHLLQLVDDVLDVAKADADRLDVRQDVLMTGAAVVAATALVHPQATAKGIRLFDLNHNAPGAAYVGDERRVRQILVNLLSNAVKFTPPAGEVTVICGAMDEPDPGAQLGERESAPSPSEAPHPGRPWAYIRVADSGPGIAPQFMSRLFEPFVQADGALTREKGGTGLGLAISRRLARRMGGDITVRSKLGAGAVFTLWLPTPRTAEFPVETATPIPFFTARRTTS
jgi:signal transduction histidine kinase